MTLFFPCEVLHWPLEVTAVSLQGFPDLRNQQKFPEAADRQTDRRDGHRASCSCCCDQVVSGRMRGIVELLEKRSFVSVCLCLSRVSLSVFVSHTRVQMSPNIPLFFYFKAVQQMSPKSQTIKGSVHAKYKNQFHHNCMEPQRELKVCTLKI